MKRISVSDDGTKTVRTEVEMSGELSGIAGKVVAVVVLALLAAIVIGGLAWVAEAVWSAVL